MTLSAGPSQGYLLVSLANDEVSSSGIITKTLSPVSLNDQPIKIYEPWTQASVNKQGYFGGVGKNKSVIKCG